MEYVIPTKECADLILDYNKTKDFFHNTRLLNAFVDLYFSNPEKYQKVLKEAKNKETKKNAINELLLHYKNVIEEREKNRKIANSLYDLVQEQVKQKGRKVKIIAD